MGGRTHEHAETHVAIQRVGLGSGCDDTLRAGVACTRRLYRARRFRVGRAGCGVAPTAYDFRWDDAETRRIYLIDTPVLYTCLNAPANGLVRKFGYGIPQLIDPAVVVPANQTDTLTMQLSPVSPCTFKYDPGSEQRSGLITIRLSLQDPAGTTMVRLSREVHVVNAP